MPWTDVNPLHYLNHIREKVTEVIFGDQHQAVKEAALEASQSLFREDNALPADGEETRQFYDSMVMNLREAVYGRLEHNGYQ